MFVVVVVVVVSFSATPSFLMSKQSGFQIAPEFSLENISAFEF